LQDDKPLVNFGYFPSYSIVKGALLNYGYLQDAPCTTASTSETAVAGWLHACLSSFITIIHDSCNTFDFESSMVVVMMAFWKFHFLIISQQKI
jgi:hypothetical protein